MGTVHGSDEGSDVKSNKMNWTFYCKTTFRELTRVTISWRRRPKIRAARPPM